MNWADFIVPKPSEGDSQTLQSFQYAGPLRIPGEKFQVRSRKEVSTKDSVNSRFVETWAASVPAQQQQLYRTDLKDGGIVTAQAPSRITPQEKEVLAAFPNGKVGIIEIRDVLANERNDPARAIGILNYKTQQDGRAKGAGPPVVPPPLEAVFFDMAPLSSRTDTRDFRQSKPYNASGPNLSLNPFFDRYDPTRDPRNMVREVRSVVYELKEPDRGQKESERIRERTFNNRYAEEGSTSTKLTEWYELMRPKIDNPSLVYRNQSELWKSGSAYIPDVS